MLGVRSQVGIELRAVVPHHIFDVGGVFQAPFNLERRNTRGDQIAQPLVQPEILEREQAAVAQQHVSLAVEQVVARAAGLDAGAAVGTPPRKGLAQIAVAAVADAEGSVHKEFQVAMHGSADGANLVERQLPLKNQPLEPQRLQPHGIFRRADGRLGGGKERDGGKIHFQDSEILDDERIDPRLDQGHHLPAGGFQLVVE